MAWLKRVWDRIRSNQIRPWCDKWLPGGKSSVTSHLRSRHQAEQCPIIMITNQGMLKVDKEDFIMDKHAKKAKMDTLNELTLDKSA